MQFFFTKSLIFTRYGAPAPVRNQNDWNMAPAPDFDYEIPKGMAGVSEDQIRNMQEGEIMVRLRIPHLFVEETFS